MGGAAVITIQTGKGAHPDTQIFRAAGLPTSLAEWSPPFRGDRSKNAFDELQWAVVPKELVKKIPANTAGGPLLCTQVDTLLRDAKRLVVLAERAAACEFYAQDYKVEDLPLDRRKISVMTPYVHVFTVQGFVKASRGDLEGGLADFAKARKLTDFLIQEPHFLGEATRVKCHESLMWRVLEASPFYVSNPSALARLREIVAGAKSPNYESIYRGAAYLAFFNWNQKFTVAKLSMLDDLTEFRPEEAPKIEADRRTWSAQMAKAWAEDIADIHREPLNPRNPALSLPHVEALKKVSGSTGLVALYFNPYSIQGAAAIRSDATRRELTLLAMDALARGRSPAVASTVDPWGTGPYKLQVDGKDWRLTSIGPPPEKVADVTAKQDSANIVVTYKNGVMSIS